MSDFPTHIIRDLRHPAIGASEKAILYSLADRMRVSTDGVWPTMQTIAGDAGLCESACRRIVRWLAANGVIVETVDAYRGKVRRIDFERLAALPTDAARPTHGRRSKKLPVPVPCLPVPTRRLPVPHQAPGIGRLPVQASLLPVSNEGLPVPVPLASRSPKGHKKAQEKETKKDSAGQVPRVQKPGGEVAGFPEVVDCYFAEFERTRNEKPIFGKREGLSTKKLLTHIRDPVKVCEMIRRAYADVFFREKKRGTINDIAADPARWLGEVAQTQQRPPKMTSMQSEGPLFGPGNGASDMAKAGW
jgi:hypothetical protein